jgi:penicillin-binding protein A
MIVNEQEQFQRKVQRLLLVVTGAFLAVALTLVYWGVIRSSALAAREDNPRSVEAALRVERGRILDDNEQILAYSEMVRGRAMRIYPVINIGPAVGYYSFRHGTAGAEEAYNDHLQGLPEDSLTRFVRELLNQPLSGRDVRLTLVAEWQQAANALLQGQTGAALLLTLPDGAIRVMASAPGYDPNQLDADFERLVADERAPLLNRVTQGQYQPGLALQPLLLAAALNDGLIGLNQVPVDADLPVTINGLQISCLPGAPDEISWRETLVWSCPSPYLDLAGIWGNEGLTDVFDGFGLTNRPDLQLATAAPPAMPVTDPAKAAIGQDSLTVSPLQLGLAMAALANEGQLRSPYLAAAWQDDDGRWQPAAPKPASGQPVSAAAAQAVLDSLPLYDNIREHAALAVAGPEGSLHSWYIGMAPANAPRYLVVVVLEQSDDLATARLIGRALLSR